MANCQGQKVSVDTPGFLSSGVRCASLLYYFLVSKIELFHTCFVTQFLPHSFVALMPDASENMQCNGHENERKNVHPLSFSAKYKYK